MFAVHLMRPDFPLQNCAGREGAPNCEELATRLQFPATSLSAAARYVRSTLTEV